MLLLPKKCCKVVFSGWLMLGSFPVFVVYLSRVSLWVSGMRRHFCSSVLLLVNVAGLNSCCTRLPMWLSLVLGL